MIKDAGLRAEFGLCGINGHFGKGPKELITRITWFYLLVGELNDLVTLPDKRYDEILSTNV